MTKNSIKDKLNFGDEVRFKDGLKTYFQKPFIGDDRRGWFKETHGSTSSPKYYKNIVAIKGKELNEIKVNPVRRYPKYIEKYKDRIDHFIQHTDSKDSLFITANLINYLISLDQDLLDIDKHLPEYISTINNYVKDYQKNMLKESIKKEYKKILKEQQEETLTFEKDPIEYIIQRYPSLDATLIDLMTESYRDFLTGIYVMAPKPTTFKILLHNGQSFYLIYNPKAYIAKVAGKQYHLMSLKDEEYAVKAISRLLLMGVPPSAEGPGEEQGGEIDPKDEFTTDMTSEPDLTAGLDDFEGDQPEGEEDLTQEPEEELQEQEEPKKKIRFRLIK
jgi:hypothetical protein